MQTKKCVSKIENSFTHSKRHYTEYVFKLLMIYLISVIFTQELNILKGNTAAITNVAVYAARLASK